MYTVLGPAGPFESVEPGTLGGHRRSKIYGRLDCPSALRAIARGGYVKHRVFFADVTGAVAAGYRPCALCLPQDYAAWISSPYRSSTRLGSFSTEGVRPQAASGTGICWEITDADGQSESSDGRDK